MAIGDLVQQIWKHQVARFVAVGAVCAVVGLSVTILTQYTLQYSYKIAITAGFVVGTALAYVLNRKYTFQSQKSWKNFIIVCVLYLITFVVNYEIYGYLSRAWAHTQLLSALAYCIAQGTATVINYLVQKFFIFTPNTRSTTAATGT